MPCSSRAAKRKRIMDTLHTRRFGRILALSWLIVLLAACSVADPAVGSARAATTLPLGTTFWTYRGVSSVFTAAWSPDLSRPYGPGACRVLVARWHAHRLRWER